MSVIRKLSFAILVLLPLGGALAEYDPGIDYKVLDRPVATSDSSKVEVVELFWYGCPHCYHFEPDLKAWLKKKPDHVNFVRVPAIFNPGWGFHAKAYYTAEALEVLPKVHGDLFDAAQKKRLKTVDDVRKIFVNKGVNASDFDDAWASFGVDTRVRQAMDLTRRYKIDGVPSLVVNGKYVTDGPMANGKKGMLKVTDALIKKEAAAIK